MKATANKLIEEAFELLTSCKTFIPKRKASDEDLMEELESWQQRVYEYWDATKVTPTLTEEELTDSPLADTVIEENRKANNE